MFFAGFGIILLVWFVASIARGKDLRKFGQAEIFGLLFVLFVVTYVVGLSVTPAAPGVWGFTLFGYLMAGLTVALLVSVGFLTRRDEGGSAGHGRTTAGEVIDAAKYETVFVALTVVTMVIALMTRFIG